MSKKALHPIQEMFPLQEMLRPLIRKEMLRPLIRKEKLILRKKKLQQIQEILMGF
jgi:hypothetical protein